MWIDNEICGMKPRFYDEEVDENNKGKEEKEKQIRTCQLKGINSLFKLPAKTIIIYQVWKLGVVLVSAINNALVEVACLPKPLLAT